MRSGGRRRSGARGAAGPVPEGGSGAYGGRGTELRPRRAPPERNGRGALSVPSRGERSGPALLLALPCIETNLKDSYVRVERGEKHPVLTKWPRWLRPGAGGPGGSFCSGRERRGGGAPLCARSRRASLCCWITAFEGKGKVKAGNLVRPTRLSLCDNCPTVLEVRLGVRSWYLNLLSAWVHTFSFLVRSIYFHFTSNSGFMQTCSSYLVAL